MALVEVRSVSKSYTRAGGFAVAGFRREERFAVRELSLEIEPGETLGLVGESGSGKSTVARMILGLVEPSSGSITVNGVRVGGAASGSAMRALRREMQPVFQDPAAALDPRMRVWEAVTEPLVIHGGVAGGETGTAAGERPGKAARMDAARELLGSVGLDGSALERYPHQFSGGQKQRINIARALALRPKFLVLDEPVSALDVSVGGQVVNLLRDLQRQRGLTYLFISHSMPLVRYLSTRIAVMQGGRLVEVGEAEELCRSPRESYTRQLLAATPELA